MPKPRKIILPTTTKEHQIALAVGKVHKAMMAKFDLSPETAKKSGTPAGQIHKPLDRNGEAKTGGEMKNGRYAISRYVSYRLGDKRVFLAGRLNVGDSVEKTYYRVMATPELQPDGEEIEPDDPAGDVRYRDFKTLEEAAKRYEEVLAKFAPRRLSSNN